MPDPGRSFVELYDRLDQQSTPYPASPAEPEASKLAERDERKREAFGQLAAVTDLLADSLHPYVVLRLVAEVYALRGISARQKQQLADGVFACARRGVFDKSPEE